jgi:site-specific DNA-methyltransferase (adenine-specific)
MNPYEPPSDDESQLDRIERRFALHHGDCLDVLKTLADCSVDAIVTDPPYGLSFMGKRWDYDVPTEAVWVECLRVLKSGGHLLAFAGTRTQHRMAVRIEDAGFEIRDMIAWVYGSGFPKSMDISKQLDKMAGAEREVVGSKITGRALGGSNWKDGNAGGQEAVDVTAPATEAAKQWEGWGTAIKPSLEPITLARKPPIGTIAANVLEHGTGGLNIDGCRVDSNGDKLGGGRISTTTEGWDRPWKHDSEAIEACKARGNEAVAKAEQLGRFPANFIHDGSEEVLTLFPETGPTGGSTLRSSSRQSEYGMDNCEREVYLDSGSAARFFYCAKASRDDRDEGLPMDQHSSHPTVKPTDLMRYLCRLITPPGGIVLDPFTGSGSTGKAAMAEGFRFIGIEREAEYFEIARARISAEAEKPRQLSLF